MESTPASEPTQRRFHLGKRGIALFMVLSTMSVLTLLVTEFVYIAQINQRLAYDNLDRLKAFYLAKSALKLSLIRLKAYQHIKGFIGGSGSAMSSAVPPQILDQIWAMPIRYPFPSELPGLTLAERESIDQFQKESSLEGDFASSISSDSSRYNINMILAPFAPTSPTGTTGVTGSTAPTGEESEEDDNGTGEEAATGTTFSAEAARESLVDYITQIYNNKIESDEDFEYEYKDFELEDFFDNLFTWMDRSYVAKLSGRDMAVPFKKAPLYSITELHQIAPLDDKLYDLFTPSLTVSTTPGINVNSMEKHTLMALVPGITEDEAKELFSHRDDMSTNNRFKSEDHFLEYLRDHVAIFYESDDEVARYKEDLKTRNIRIVVDETNFTITVYAQVKQTFKTIEAQVVLSSSSTTSTSTTTPTSTSSIPSLSGPGRPNKPDAGMKITFMRIQ